MTVSRVAQRAARGGELTCDAKSHGLRGFLLHLVAGGGAVVAVAKTADGSEHERPAPGAQQLV